MLVLDLGTDASAALQELITFDQGTGFRSGSTSSAAVLGIGAVMHHPKDDEARRSYVAACYSSILAEVQAERDRQAKGTPEWVALDWKYRYWQASFDAAGGFVALRHAKPRDRMGLPKGAFGDYAGHLLLRILERAEHCPEEATVRKACNYLERAVVRGHSASRATIMAAWGDFKTVAHLWAASALFAYQTVHFGEHQVSLRDFLATAEELRRRGESWHPQGRATSKSQPVLDPVRTWRVDPNIDLPKVRLSLERLPYRQVV